MTEFSDLITQVSSNDKTETNIKNETLQILYDAQGIINLAKKESKEKWDEVSKKYENLRTKTIDSLKDNSEITAEELNSLKSQIETTHEYMADFYVKNQEMLNLETNKDIVLKTLKKLVKDKKIDTSNPKGIDQLTVNLNDINRELRWDLEVLKATRAENVWFTAEDIHKIPSEFFKNEKNVEELLKQSAENWLIILIASKNMEKKQLINLIWKTNKEAVDVRDKVLDKEIPLELLEADKENIMWLDKTWKENHLKKIDEITKDSIDELINKNKTEDLAYEVEYFLYKFKVNDLSDSTIVKILNVLVKDNTLQYAPKFVFGLNEKTDIIKNYIKNNDVNIIKFLPAEILKNNDIQKSIIDKIVVNSNSNSSNDLLLNYIEVDDYEIAKYFYDSINALWEVKANKIFSNFRIRENIKRIVDNDKFKKDENNKQMLDHLSSYDWWWKDLIDAAVENHSNLEKINDDEKLNFSINLIKKLGLTDKVDVKKMKGLIDRVINLEDNNIWKNESKELYNELLKICWTQEKVKVFIAEVKNYKIKQLELDNDNKIKELKEKKFDKFNVSLDNIKSDFEEFLANKIRELKEKNKDKPIDIEAISKQAIEEYIENNKKEWITEKEKNIIRGILKNSVTIRKTRSEIENVDSYVKTMTWEMKKEEYNKVIQQSLEKSYIYGTKSDIFIPTEDNYSKTDWWYNLIWKNWEPIKWLIISEQEKNQTIWNPEATKNLVNFYDFFKQLNLEWVWKYRNELMTAVWNINIDPNDGDSIKTEELRKFWNSLLTFIANAWKENKDWEKKKINLPSIQYINQELMNFSWASSYLNDKATFDIYWEDRFTAFLRQQWIIWWAYFKVNEFRKFL